MTVVGPSLLPDLSSTGSLVLYFNAGIPINAKEIFLQLCFVFFKLFCSELHGSLWAASILIVTRLYVCEGNPPTVTVSRHTDQLVMQESISIQPLHVSVGGAASRGLFVVVLTGFWQQNSNGRMDLAAVQ